jgi:hypothetical protein
MPQFRREDHLEGIHRNEATARAVRLFWDSASIQERADSDFLTLLVRLGWCNVAPGGEYSPTTKRWRDSCVGEYLGADAEGMALLTAALQRWPKMDRLRLQKVFDSDTGIASYYTAFRPATLESIQCQGSTIARIFRIVGKDHEDWHRKIARAMDRIATLPSVSTPRGGKTSMLNAISPALACLDPQRRFPIINQVTEALLRSVGAQRDASGAIILAEMIGQNGIKTNLDLDIYSQCYKFPALRKHGRPVSHPRTRDSRIVGLKSEEEGFAEISRQRRRIKKLHNQLTNRFRALAIGRFPLEESDFDLLIPKWNKRRDLLIEAKTAWAGSGGRLQVRQAIGQLFDYRKTYFGDHASDVDLAVLLPQEPAKDIVDLLRSLDIHCLWLSGDKVTGTLNLPW